MIDSELKIKPMSVTTFKKRSAQAGHVAQCNTSPSIEKALG